MPTENPRIGLTVSFEMYDLILQVSQMLGRSMSGLVVEVLEDQKETLEQIQRANLDNAATRQKFLENYVELAEKPFHEIKQDAVRQRPCRRQSKAA